MQSKTTRVLFRICLAISGILLISSLGLTVWAQSGDEGWVSKAVIALTSWFITAPFLVVSGVWSVVALVKRRRIGNRISEVSAYRGNIT